MQVKKQKFADWQEAVDFVVKQLWIGYANIRIITAKSRLAKRYGIEGAQVQVRYWK